MQIDASWLAQSFPDLSRLAPLSSGGQKTVYAAEHPADGEVVLKLIKPSQSVETTEREILAVQSVQSPRVPQILEKGTVASQLGDLVWLREQRITGATLRTRLQQGPLPEIDVLRLGLQMLEALAMAESVEIVHRDVKPDNIMADGLGDYWLLDFGLARHLQLDSLTATASPFGKFTAGYAPTEQFRNDKDSIDGRVDLFGLGVTLYECFTGTNPFRSNARDHLEVLRRVERVPLPRLKLSLAAGPEMADLVAAMTHKRRDQRPRNVAYALDWVNVIGEAEGI